MTWTILVAQTAQKQLARIPGRDRVTAAVLAMAAAPFKGDLVKLEGHADRYRRQVGSYHIFFRVDWGGGTVGISAIVRRTSNALPPALG